MLKIHEFLLIEIVLTLILEMTKVKIVQNDKNLGNSSFPFKYLYEQCI